MKYVSSMIVPSNCHILFEMSWQSGPCTPILNTENIFILSLGVGQTEHLPWVQNGPFGFEKTYHM